MIRPYLKLAAVSALYIGTTVSTLAALGVNPGASGVLAGLGWVVLFGSGGYARWVESLPLPVRRVLS